MPPWVHQGPIQILSKLVGAFPISTQNLQSIFTRPSGGSLRLMRFCMPCPQMSAAVSKNPLQGCSRKSFSLIYGNRGVFIFTSFCSDPSVYSFLKAHWNVFGIKAEVLQMLPGTASADVFVPHPLLQCNISFGGFPLLLEASCLAFCSTITKKNFLRFTAQDEVMLEVSTTWTAHAQKIASEKWRQQQQRGEKPAATKCSSAPPPVRGRRGRSTARGSFRKPRRATSVKLKARAGFGLSSVVL